MTDRDPAPAQWTAPDLKTTSLSELFTLYGRILDELEDRTVVRTRNQPLGDYAEWLTWQALVGKQSKNKAEKAYDITADLSTELLAGNGPDAGGHDGARIQVKARSLSPKPRPGQLQTSPFHASGFDYLVLVLHEAADYAVRRAVLLPLTAALAYAKPASARRDDVLRLSMTPRVMDDPSGTDISNRLRAVAERS